MFAPTPPSFSSYPLIEFTLNWTPRLIVMGLTGYYSLGIAYEKGMMAAIDRFAIRIFRHSMGYAGVGAIMPVFQWYAAWGVRFISAIAAGLIYDIVKKISLLFYRRFFSQASVFQPANQISERQVLTVSSIVSLPVIDVKNEEIHSHVEERKINEKPLQVLE